MMAFVLSNIPLIVILLGLAAQTWFVRGDNSRSAARFEEIKESLATIKAKQDDSSQEAAWKGELGEANEQHRQLGARVEEIQESLAKRISALETQVAQLDSQMKPVLEAVAEHEAATRDAAIDEVPSKSAATPRPAQSQDVMRLRDAYNEWVRGETKQSGPNFEARYRPRPCSVGADGGFAYREVDSDLVAVLLGDGTFVFPGPAIFQAFSQYKKRLELQRTEVPNCYECEKDGSGTLSVLTVAEVDMQGGDRKIRRGTLTGLIT